MRVCFFNVNAYSLFNPMSGASVGGTEVQLFSLAMHLARDSSLDIRFIVGDWGQKKVEDVSGVKVCRSFSLQKSLWNYIIAPFLLWHSLKENDADVYIASSAGVEIGIIAFFCKLHDRKFIYRTAHDWDCNGEYVKKNGVFGKVFEYGLKSASSVVAQNSHHADLLRRNYGISATVIKNAWKIEGDDITNKKDILWVSRCEKWKNPELLLEIAERLKGYRFIMICPKQDGEYFKSVAERASHIENVRFIAGVPFFEIQKYFNTAKLFLGTSEYEGFPNTYLQACVGATPIISYKVNPDSFITQNKIGECANGDLEFMVRRISDVLEDDVEWNRYSRNAREYVKKNHDMDTIGHQWIGLMNQSQES